MNRKTVYSILMGIVVVAVGACTDAKTSADAPNSADKMAQTPMAKSTETAKADAQSDVRARQLESDIRAREQRGNAMGNGQNRNDGDLASEVRSKLEANIPGGSLTVASKDGVVTVAGTVSTADQLSKIQKLGMEIKGVKGVNVTATVASKPN